MNITKQVSTPVITELSRPHDTLEGHINEFLRFLKSPYTQRAYRSALRSFSDYITANPSGGPMTAADLNEYMKYLLKGGRSARTVNMYLSALKRFFKYLEAGGHYMNIARTVEGMKVKRQFTKYALTAEQAGELVNHYRTELEVRENEKSLRNLAMVHLMLRAGLRLIEVVRANVSDIKEIDGKTVLWVQGKGRDEKDEFVQLSDVAKDIILTYLEARGAKPSEPLFIGAGNRNRGRITTRHISRIVKAGLRAIGIDSEKYTAHSLRHTFAVLLYKAGVPIEDIQKLLRHSDIATTLIYLKSIEDEERLKRNHVSILDDKF